MKFGYIDTVDMVSGNYVCVEIFCDYSPLGHSVVCEMRLTVASALGILVDKKAAGTGRNERIALKIEEADRILSVIPATRY